MFPPKDIWQRILLHNTCNFKRYYVVERILFCIVLTGLVIACKATDFLHCCCFKSESSISLYLFGFHLHIFINTVYSERRV